MRPITEAGIVVIGSEILTGKRQDKHLGHVIEILARRGMQLAWCHYVNDDRKTLTEQLLQTRYEEIPVFCFGGIGITPDDQTRQAAADAFGVDLVSHQQAVELIEQQFGKSAYPKRVLMANFPRDAEIIPNPINQVPGFSLFDHHFFPGFPQMAWPMLDWVLDQYYRGTDIPHVERSVRVQNVPESELLDMLKDLSMRHTDANLFSLPRMTDQHSNGPSVEVGFRGPGAVVGLAFDDLIEQLDQSQFKYDQVRLAS